MQMKHTTHFVVEPFSEDYAGRLSWGILGNQLLRCASLHAGSHGFGYEDMVRDRRVWVLSRLSIHMDEMPTTGCEYEIQTWVSKVYRQFTDRQFAIVGRDGKVYGYASSTWALINLDSRSAVDLTGMKDNALFNFVIDEVAPIPSPARVRITSDAPIFTHRAAYTDLDINGHVNSIRYIQMALDCLSEFIYKQNLRVQRVEVGYAAEGMCGDELQFFANELTATGGGIEVRNESGTTLAKINVVLGE
ncbi:MAG: acyl-[Bacteroidaceae bacterium]|nr:acyl-[acyl-carrier-protein] thioesterase [Bacteroidaceae bacterium]